MSEAVYNDQLVNAYLLGSLPDADIERMDELSIADDEFASALSVAEKELVDSYVRGELSASEFKRFESYYLTSTLRRDKVEFARALQIFGERAATSSVSAKAARPKTAWLSNLFGNSRPVLQWGFGLATLLFVIAAGLLAFQNFRLRQQVNQTQARHEALQQREHELQKELENQRTANATTAEELTLVRDERARLEEQLRSGKPQPSPDKAAIASLILTPQLRGAGQIKTVTLSPVTERVAMQLQLEPNEYSTYSVALIDQSSGQTLWRSGRLKAAGSGDRKLLSVSFRAALLRAGTYRMQVSGISAGGATEVIGEYPFRVSR